MIFLRSLEDIWCGLTVGGIWAGLRGGRVVDSGRLGRVLSPACGDLALMEMRVSLRWAGGDPPVLTSLMTREKSPFPLALAICRRMVSFCDASWWLGSVGLSRTWRRVMSWKSCCQWKWLNLSSLDLMVGAVRWYALIGPKIMAGKMMYSSRPLSRMLGIGEIIISAM